MVDMDFASDPETILPDDLSDSLEERRIKAGIGEKAKMAIGIEWRSPDVSKELITNRKEMLTLVLKYVAFLH